MQHTVYGNIDVTRTQKHMYSFIRGYLKLSAKLKVVHFDVKF